MIINLNSFIQEEKPYWTELEQILGKLRRDSAYSLDMEGVKRFHYLYQRASSGLAKMMNFSAEQDIKKYLESLVGQAYSEIHETRRSTVSFKPLSWFLKTFPRTFRKHGMAFLLSFLIMAGGSLFGALAIGFDSESKEALMPFSHLMENPENRVAREEAATQDVMAGHKSTFSSSLIANNTKVAIFAMGLGISWGIGTLIVLFTNGVYLGATVADYILSGQAKFLVGWLLPHGSTEIPAILIAGQAGLVLAGAMIGWGQPVTLTQRLREVSKDLVTLIGGVTVLLFWAGFVESFLSQYHEPVISYEAKIAFGTVVFGLLCLFLLKSGRKKPDKSMIRQSSNIS